MERVTYKDEKGNVIFDQTYFSPKELKDAAIVIFNKFPSECNNPKDVYDDLRCLLGVHYWTYDYGWEKALEGVV